MDNMILFVGFAPQFIVLGIVIAWHFWRKRDRRRSPLNVKVINLPGEYLRKEIARHGDAIDEVGVLSVVIGPVVLSIWLFIRLSRVVPDWSKIEFGLEDLYLGLLTILVIAWCVSCLIKHAKLLRKYREGLLGELAVAQCLTPLAADGGLIFHDFPADNFNIDHIVIGKGAVFAVETKSRKKPAGNGRESAKIVYDGKSLKYPASFETKPIEQARFQAKWLESFLSSGVGEPIRVIPILALPGWFIENTASRPDVLVTNCRNPSFMMSDKFGVALSDSMKKRIAHVLLERYPQIDLTS